MAITAGFPVVYDILWSNLCLCCVTIVLLKSFIWWTSNGDKKLMSCPFSICKFHTCVTDIGSIPSSYLKQGQQNRIFFFFLSKDQLVLFQLLFPFCDCLKSELGVYSAHSWWCEISNAILFFFCSVKRIESWLSYPQFISCNMLSNLQKSCHLSFNELILSKCGILKFARKNDFLFPISHLLFSLLFVSFSFLGSFQMFCCTVLYWCNMIFLFWALLWKFSIFDLCLKRRYQL